MSRKGGDSEKLGDEANETPSQCGPQGPGGVSGGQRRQGTGGIGRVV